MMLPAIKLVLDREVRAWERGIERRAGGHAGARKDLLASEREGEGYGMDVGMYGMGGLPQG